MFRIKVIINKIYRTIKKITKAIYQQFINCVQKLIPYKNIIWF